MRIFIDTNIFLDLILKRDNYKESLEIFNCIEKGLFKAYILDITILNIDYIAKKQTHDIRDFLTLVNNVFHIVGASNVSIKNALNINNNDLEDNLQYVSAKELKCQLIVTNDKNFYSKDIKLVNSTKFCSDFLN